MLFSSSTWPAMFTTHRLAESTETYQSPVHQHVPDRLQLIGSQRALKLHPKTPSNALRRFTTHRLAESTETRLARRERPARLSLQLIGSQRALKH